MCLWVEGEFRDLFTGFSVHVRKTWEGGYMSDMRVCERAWGRIGWRGARVDLKVGMRTDVHETGRVGMPMIFWHSHVTFISSLV